MERLQTDSSTIWKFGQKDVNLVIGVRPGTGNRRVADSSGKIDKVMTTFEIVKKCDELSLLIAS